MTPPGPPQVAAWRVAPGHEVDLGRTDAASTDGDPGGRPETEAAAGSMRDELASLQDRLWAEERRSLLVVLQGIDASGKDGTIKHVFAGLNPLGTRAVAFKEPTPVELAHDFLWRVHAQVPRAGEVAIFNRSHYEDVIVVRVHRLVPDHVWRARYEQINDFEALLTASGTTIVKFYLHISRQEQEERLRARREQPDKRWKYRSTDLEAQQHWDDYVAAYDEMLRRTSTGPAPWYVVPADHKWYRNWAVSSVLLATLRSMGPRYPEPAAGGGC